MDGILVIGEDQRFNLSAKTENENLYEPITLGLIEYSGYSAVQKNRVGYSRNLNDLLRGLCDPTCWRQFH